MFSTVRRLSKSRTSFRKGKGLHRTRVTIQAWVCDLFMLIRYLFQWPTQYCLWRRPGLASTNCMCTVTSLTDHCSTRSKFEIVMEKVDKLEEEMQNLQDTLLYCESVRLLEKTLLPGFLPYHEHIRTYMYISKLHCKYLPSQCHSSTEKYKKAVTQNWRKLGTTFRPIGKWK